MSEAIKAVVLDWAGTVIDHGCRAPVVALLRVFQDAGVAVTEAEAREVALADVNVQRFTEGKEIVKIIAKLPKMISKVL